MDTNIEFPVLNLINKDNSDISYEIIRFSDGESHIKLGEINRKQSIRILTRISSWDDLMILMQIGDILNRQEVEIDDLCITYLLTMRMDRVMNFNEAYTLKIVANMINSLNANCVEVIEPHSSKTVKLINNAVHVPSTSLFDFKNSILVFPDAGATERYINSGIVHDCCAYLTVNKKRNAETGKIEKMEFDCNIDKIKPFLNGSTSDAKKVVVIDDLCDFGGTFLGVHKLLRDAGCTLPIHICVTHMVNEKGIENLAKTFDKVEFTNSYAEWGERDFPDNVNVIKMF